MYSNGNSYNGNSSYSEGGTVTDIRDGELEAPLWALVLGRPVEREL